MTTNRRLLTLACAVAVFNSAGAQDAPEQEPEAPRRYNVEVIVFTYEEDVSVGNEVFVPEIPPALRMDTDATQDSAQTDTSGPPGVVDGPGGMAVDADVPADVPADPPTDTQTAGIEPEFVITPDAELGMLDVRETLERLDVYRPVFHAGWTQAGLPRADTVVIDLDMLDQPPPDLSGSFTLYLSRYLHLVVDLTLEKQTLSETPVAVDFPNSTYNMRDGSPLPRPGVRYRIDEDRIFKNGDTRYFDHPKFGVVARIVRIEEADEDASDPDAGTLLEQVETAD